MPFWLRLAFLSNYTVSNRHTLHKPSFTRVGDVKKILGAVATPIFASGVAKSQTLLKTCPKRPFWRDNQKMLKMTNFSSYLRVFKVPQKSFQLLKTCTEHGVGTLKHVTFGFWNVCMMHVLWMPCKLLRNFHSPP